MKLFKQQEHPIFFNGRNKKLMVNAMLTTKLEISILIEYSTTSTTRKVFCIKSPIEWRSLTCTAIVIFSRR